MDRQIKAKGFIVQIYQNKNRTQKKTVGDLLQRTDFIFKSTARH